jgi:uncharacterized SAM-binding protein YcdF (DUF218 family)
MVPSRRTPARELLRALAWLAVGLTVVLLLGGRVSRPLPDARAAAAPPWPPHEAGAAPALTGTSR